MSPPDLPRTRKMTSFVPWWPPQTHRDLSRTVRQKQSSTAACSLSAVQLLHLSPTSCPQRPSSGAHTESLSGQTSDLIFGPLSCHRRSHTVSVKASIRETCRGELICSPWPPLSVVHRAVGCIHTSGSVFGRYSARPPVRSQDARGRKGLAESGD